MGISGGKIRFAGKIRAVALAGVVLATASCVTQFRNHGYAPSQADLANVIVGSDTRTTVANLIGRPLTESMLQDSAWYYVESRFRIFAYTEPKEIAREVVAISFAANGRVSNIERFGLEDGRVVALSRRVTATSSVKVPLLKRLLGNIGQLGAGFLG